MGIYINNNGTIERKDGAPGPAGSIAYDNTQSGLVSNNVQNAIDEVNERVIENISDNASIELTATAAHAHAVGTSFMLIGQLVKTTSAIAVGDTIAVGTNVEPTSVLSILTELNSKTSPNGVYRADTRCNDSGEYVIRLSNQSRNQLQLTFNITSKEIYASYYTGTGWKLQNIANFS